MSELDQYDYELPRELIAQFPLAVRSDARLMVIDRASGDIDHFHVRNLAELVNAGDCLVVNDTRVTPARLVGKRTQTGGRWEGLYLGQDEHGVWRLLGKTRGRLQPGETITLEDRSGRPDIRLAMLTPLENGHWAARPESPEETQPLLERIGRTPLPPYIRGGQMVDADRENYQTVYARHPGAVAAPTAGLHFTPGLLDQLAKRGLHTAQVTLHVGLGTFKPISTETLAEHPMHSERYQVTEEAAAQINACRAAGGKAIAIGTTAVRTLESSVQDGQVIAGSGETNLFIRPPYKFQAVDSLLTNFHLPRSTLLVLVSTFAGQELIRRAYRMAIEERYRFYSYGDAMLIL
ncbi:tRNA preQ1(34) S-adenosylmethionine ribosyltransferase-isomerase QueA [Lignipirellula cremea]|uniref:S-adenosylmethionine:tRNA ribosyltransferase-isomerase n=1 Tax=Lignipirellula cremea TaxID=2528010 RepID=A0A518E187_9BACT|nr:tRNA preQ1(34) S-adenosylmethionine ribosyltransferase-isomerase QueA [Lignipirellula cremea]QDU97855.1 S-adenosylmethionine:tRNA ribosyltransferase-isomerase [Lignipirellula cremea]